MTTPQLQRRGDGRFLAQCGRCTRFSADAGAADEEKAWLELERAGWTFFVSEFGGSGYAVCPTCASAPRQAITRRTRKKR